jgi:hypothetical protein
MSQELPFRQALPIRKVQLILAFFRTVSSEKLMENLNFMSFSSRRICNIILLACKLFLNFRDWENGKIKKKLRTSLFGGLKPSVLLITRKLAKGPRATGKAERDARLADLPALRLRGWGWGRVWLLEEPLATSI